MLGGGSGLCYNFGWRVPSHWGAVNRVRCGSKQPQPFATSAEVQARQHNSPMSGGLLAAVCFYSNLFDGVQHEFI